MSFTLDNAVFYDVESFPNLFTLNAVPLNGDVDSTWEISTYRDDRHQLFTFFNHLRQTQSPMIGFNNLSYDYPLIHWIFKNPQCTVEQIYHFSKNIIDTNNRDRFGSTIWPRDRFAPQIDLFKIFHFDNKAKTTNLKALQINMRSENVMESSVEFDTFVQPHQVPEVITYNRHDTAETKKFGIGAMSAINFRMVLVDKFGVEVLNWNDTKIGENILIDKIGKDICYTKDHNGRSQKRQTIRQSIDMRDVIFPYISFQNPEFQRILDYMRAQVLRPEEFVDIETGEQSLGETIKTKGVFSNLKAHVGGLDFYFGTGGIHASIEKQHVRAGNGLRIRDIDVAALYPSIAIVNRLYPEHLGESFVAAYAELPKERKIWQKKKGKKCPEANSFKLGSNGAYGKSNDKFSVLFDPLFTMRITINGQLMIAMLVEKLITVPTLQIIQANTDGITYRIHEDYIPQAVEIEKAWQDFTLLVLEDVEYSDMWIRDVNNYVAKPVAEPGKNDIQMKLKGAYWHPEPGDRYFDSISEAQPPAWHKDLGNLVSIKAAIAAMTQGIDPELFIRFHTDPYDFMKRIKVGRSDVLRLGQVVLQRNTRYYVARQGDRMIKISPPPKGATVGHYKRANGVTDTTFGLVMRELTAQGTPLAWDERIHTKNKSTYEMRETQIEAGYKVAECNDAKKFDFANVDYAYYVAEARKLIIA
ncbi:hypothetical protein HUU40_00010 [candidate division KSB1 bacterium]|nr:hypothetical protein [candidate division KSB1 bacterium]